MTQGGQGALPLPLRLSSDDWSGIEVEDPPTVRVTASPALLDVAVSTMLGKAERGSAGAE